MSKINSVILFFVITSGIIQPQQVSVGTGIGPNVLIFDGGFETGINLYLTGNFSPVKIIKIEFRPGITFNADFIGFEFGSYLKIFPFQPSVYFIGGLKLHWNVEQNRTGKGTRGGLFKLPAIGIGYKTKYHKTFLTFDLVYQKPYPNGVHWSYVENEYGYSDDFNAVISLNIGFSWEL